MEQKATELVYFLHVPTEIFWVQNYFWSELNEEYIVACVKDNIFLILCVRIKCLDVHAIIFRIFGHFEIVFMQLGSYILIYISFNKWLSASFLLSFWLGNLTWQCSFSLPLPWWWSLQYHLAHLILATWRTPPPSSVVTHRLSVNLFPHASWFLAECGPKLFQSPPTLHPTIFFQVDSEIWIWLS
jgi:hypothetical protein